MWPSNVDMARHSIRLLDSKSGHAQTRRFHPSAYDAPARWIDTHKALDGGSHLYLHPRRHPLSDHYVRGLLHCLGAMVDVSKRTHPHGLRDTFAVELVNADGQGTVSFAGTRTRAVGGGRARLSTSRS